MHGHDGLAKKSNGVPIKPWAYFAPLLPAKCERVKSPDWKDMTTPAIPAKRFRFSRFRGTVQQGPVQWQEWQIVQSQFDLRDLLP